MSGAAFTPAPITSDMIEEIEVHTFVAEASDLGWRPWRGEWPRKVETTGIGNGLAFLLWSATADKATYRQANGCIVLKVFND
jgi:hypothetical protein